MQVDLFTGRCSARAKENRTEKPVPSGDYLREEKQKWRERELQNVCGIVSKNVGHLNPVSSRTRAGYTG